MMNMMASFKFVSLRKMSPKFTPVHARHILIQNDDVRLGQRLLAVPAAQ
jgi:hypothetical protein